MCYSLIRTWQDKLIRRSLGLNVPQVSCFVQVPDRITARHHFRHQVGTFLPDELSFIAKDPDGIDIEFYSFREFKKHLIAILKITKTERSLEMADYVNINIAGRSKEAILAWIVEVTLWGKGYNAPVFVTAGTGMVIPEDLKAFENAVRNDLPGYLYRNFNIRIEAPKGMPAKVVPKTGRKKK